MPVVFDLGNVALNWDPVAVCNALPFDERIRYIIHRELFNHSDWLAMDQGFKTERQVIARLSGSTGISEDQAETALQRARESLVEIPETIALMEELDRQSVDLYCLSNMSLENFEYVREKPFFRLFKGAVISSQERTMKPQPAIFERLLSRFQLRATESFFVDDHPANIAAAARLGIDGVVFDRVESTFQLIRERVAALEQFDAGTKKAG